MNFIIAFLFLFSYSLLSIDKNEYNEIKNLIKEKQLEKAYSILKAELDKNPHDPTLSLYKTKIWIAKADTYYNKNQYKKALFYYEKAYKAWQTHPVVRERYLELKKMGIEPEETDILYKEPEKKENQFIINFPEFKQNSNEEGDNRKVYDKLKDIEEKINQLQLKMVFGFGILFGTHLVLLLYIFLTGRK